VPAIFFTEEMLEDIVRYTNQYINTVRNNFKRERDTGDTDLCEIKGFIGLLYFAGTLHTNRLTPDNLWGTDGDGAEIFRQAMSLQRFRFLYRCLRFDDRTTRDERKQIDNIAALF